jgi:selenocysteine lyase/cysteine desulfurase
LGRVPVASFVVEGWSPAELAAVLDDPFDIAVRAGLHCAPGAHAGLGTGEAGAVRISPGPESAEPDLAAWLAALREILA